MRVSRVRQPGGSRRPARKAARRKMTDRRMSGDDVEAGDIVYPSAVPFVLVHLACLGAIWSGFSWPAIVLRVTLYWLRIFAIGAGYHRYFAHRAYATSR